MELLDVFPAMRDVKQWMVYLGLSSARMMGLIAILPVFKRTELGRAILAVIALALALPIMGGLQPRIDTLPIDRLWVMAGLMVKEFAVGFLIGLFFGIPIWAIQAGGEMIDTQRSIAGASGLSDNATGEQASVMSSLLGLAAITIFVAEGGLALTISTLYGSYAAWGVDEFLPVGAGLDAIAHVGGLIAQVMLAGLLLAAPFVILFLLSDIGTMALGRMTGSIDISGLLPLVKNLLFAFVALIYIQLLVGYMRDDLAGAASVGRLFEILAGDR